MNNTSKLYRLTCSAIMAALLCILSPMSIPIGPIPVSLAIFAVCLSAYILGAKYAALSVLIYLFLGLAGLPVFSGYSGGLAKLAGPTGGYLIGYLFTAFISGYAAEKSSRANIITALGMVTGVLTAYIFGTIWFMLSTDAALGYALSVCVIPFVPLDLIKIAAAMILGKVLTAALNHAGLL